MSKIYVGLHIGYVSLSLS